MIYIRSQNKKIIVPLNQPVGADENNAVCYFDELENSYGFKLGLYSTEEKAMKVMDMIDKSIIRSNNGFGNVGSIQNWVGNISTQRNVVFKMPQEDEV